MPTFDDTLAKARDHHAHGRWAMADSTYREAMRIDHMDPRVWACHGSLALERAHVADATGANLPAAIYMLDRALQLDPTNIIALSNLAAAYNETGRIEDAMSLWERAIELYPDEPVLQSARLFGMLSHPAYDEGVIAHECEKWQLGLKVEPYTSWHGTRDADRTLRVAYVSPNLHNHAVERFASPLFAHHDAEKFSVYVYDTSGPTVKVRDPAGVVVDIGAVSDAKLAEFIRDVNLADIAVDLSGHTRGGRPLMFARKPAPICVHYLSAAGDPYTTDYYITDRHLTPHDDPRALVIPSYWAYTPPKCAPEVGPLPALANGYITFGSLNNFGKVNAEVLAAWREILARVLTSRFVMLCPPSERARTLAAMGCDAGRVEFVNRMGLEEYFACYNRIDVVLDTFPYAGGTTTMDAMWMSVPVISMAGNKPVARAGESIVQQLSFGTVAATSPKEYADEAVDLAGRPEVLDILRLNRLNLRRMMQRGKLCDIPAHTRSIEDAYRIAWTQYCKAANQ